MKCVSYTRTLPWKNHQGEMAIAEQNQRIAAYLAEHKELDLLKKYSDRKNDEKARTAFDQMTDDGVERKFDCIIVAWSTQCTRKTYPKRYGLLCSVRKKQAMLLETMLRMAIFGTP